jgi:O-acetyl-ADP-ribose deacetylase (regulator of RNase III)
VKPFLAFFHPSLPFDHDRFPRNCRTHPLVLGRHHPLPVMRSSMRRTPRGSAAMESMARSIGLRDLSFLPDAGDWAAVPPGEARLTGGYRLPASHIIDTIGPIWRGGAAGERQLPESCYRSCLDIACEREFREIAFPAIATGIYGCPREAAARIAVATVGAHLAREQFPELVTFVCFDAPTLDTHRDALGAKV